jgi:glycosyltransferase involved in cell wall biosynthesis
VTTSLSVVTCSYNPRPDYLEQVISALKCQSLEPSRWEYLLIDNASTEPLAARFDLSWHPNARHIREDQLGLTQARLRGIRESQGELLIFVDDDNVLDPDFLERALKIADEWPRLGSWSGQTRPGFEVEPPEWTKRYWGNLVIRSFDRDLWSNLPHLTETMPCGAGLCVRRNVAGHYLFLHDSGKRNFVLDRTGGSLLSAGDNDLAACACDVGLGVGLFRTLNLVHLIPAERLKEEYLLRLTAGIAYSAVILRSFRNEDRSMLQRPTRRKLADLLRMALMTRRDRDFFRATIQGVERALSDLTAVRSRTSEPIRSSVSLRQS